MVLSLVLHGRCESLTQDPTRKINSLQPIQKSQIQDTQRYLLKTNHLVITSPNNGSVKVRAVLL